jgi:NaMN:DMB phosphoribosyltransferase
MKERIPDGLREMLAQATGAGHLPWRALLKPGDWLLLVCAAALVAASYPLLWRGGVADRAIVSATASWSPNWRSTWRASTRSPAPSAPR